MITYASYSLNLMHTTSFSSLKSIVFSLSLPRVMAHQTQEHRLPWSALSKKWRYRIFGSNCPSFFYMISAIRKNFVPVILSGRSERTTSLSTFQASISFSNVHAAFAGLVDGRHKASRSITALVYLL